MLLIPLALSLLTTGYGIYQGVRLNDQAAQDGQTAVEQQIDKNLVATLADDAAYRRALVAADTARQAAALQQQKMARFYSALLYLIGGSLLLVIVLMLVHRPKKGHVSN